MNLADARLSWSARAQLAADASLTSVPGGWSRAIGGVDPHLAMRARVGGYTPGDTYAAMDADQLWVVPGVRGCIWVVPREDVSLALRTSDQQARRRTIRDIEKLGQDSAALEALGDLACGVLEGGPQSTDGLRTALGDAVTSFGAAGKKLGVTTNLPPALRLLEWAGRIRRRQAGRNLDNTYLWCLADEDPLGLGVSPTDPLEQAIELARRFFAWASPATLEEFVTWYGGTKTNAKKAVAALGLTAVDVDGRECFVDGDVGPPAAGPHFVPAQDNLLSLRSSMALLADPELHDLDLVAMRGTVKLRDARWMFHRVVMDQGRIVGLWEWDRDAQDVVCAGFYGDVDTSGLASFVRDELGGEAKGNAIDGPKSQKKRVDAVRGFAG